MGVKSYARLAVAEINQIVENLKEDEAQALVAEIQRANRVFVAGAGRSLLMMRAFSMRLMHLGIRTCVVGDVTTPAITGEDLLVFASASGETETLLVMRSKAKKAGARIALLTAHTNSTLAASVDCLVKIPGATDKVRGGFQSKQPAGSSFEQSLLVFSEGVVEELAESRGFDMSAGFSNHANLE